MADAKGSSKKKKVKKNIPVGVAHIQATFNNTIVTITDPTGNVVSWSSAGAHGFIADQEWGGRWWNIPGPELYERKTKENGHGRLREEKVSKEQAELEFFLLHLRTKQGFSIEEFEEAFNKSFEQQFSATVEELVKEDFVQLASGRLAPTTKGFLFSDSILQAFAEACRD